MPISLEPLSRRRFLTHAFAGCAALALKPSLFAAARKTDSQSWVLFSDIHLAEDRKLASRNVNMADHFQKASAEVLALPKRPAAIFINGDCAYNNGEKGDYALVAELVAPLRADGMPVHMALGNHDNRERFWAGLQDQNVKRPLEDKQAALIKSSRVNWFVLDSLEKTNSTPGLLGEEQLDWLAKTLDANSSKPAIIMIHHNPGEDKSASFSISGLKDTQSLFNIIRPRKQVKAYIFGHTHDWKVDRDPSGIHLVNLPPVAYVFKDGNPSGWVHATMGRSNMRLELRCLDTKHAAHGQVRDLEWRA